MGHITTPLAALKAFSLLRDEHDPDWYFLLSGSDYPARPAQEVLTELSSARHDVFLDYREIAYGVVPPHQTATDGGFSRKGWTHLAYDRHCAHYLWWPRISKERLLSGRIPFRREYVFIRNPRVLRWLQRYRPPQIFAGRFWFHGNHKAISRLLDNATQSMLRYYRRRIISEESLFHTILCGSDLQICTDSKRYEDWTTSGDHPKWLTVSDVPKIMASGAFFARKLRADGVVQRSINEALYISI